MENNIQVFESEQFGAIRINVLEGNEIEINLEDAARGLGFTQTQNKGGKIYTSIRWERVYGYLEEVGFSPKSGGNGYIPEAVFYMLAMKASNEAARKFQRWIAFEVVRNIRKHGGYVSAKKAAQIVEDPRAVLDLLKQVAAEQAKVAELAARVAEMLPKVAEYERYLKADGLIRIGTIAQEYGVTAAELNLHLKRLGVQHRVGSPKHGHWQLTACAMREMAARGEVWTETRQHVFTRADGSEGLGHPFMYWTPQGAAYIRELFAEMGIKPKG